MAKTTLKDLQEIIDKQDEIIKTLEKQVGHYKKVIGSLKNLIELTEHNDGQE